MTNDKIVVCYVKVPVTFSIRPNQRIALDEHGSKIRNPNTKNHWETEFFTVEEALNIAYGFPDGECNITDPSGKIVAKPMAENENEVALESASFTLGRSMTRMAVVAVYKDGTFEFVRMEK